MIGQLVEKEREALKKHIDLRELPFGEMEIIGIRGGKTHRNYSVKLVTTCNNRQNPVYWRFIALRDGEVVGWRSMLNESGDEFCLDRHRTMEEDKGIGSMLLAEALKKAEEKKAGRVFAPQVGNTKWLTHLIEKMGGRQNRRLTS